MLMPRLMLADLNTAIFSEAERISETVSSERAVVQQMKGFLRFRANSRIVGTAFALEKSMMTSNSSVHSLRLVYTGKS